MESVGQATWLRASSHSCWGPGEAAGTARALHVSVGLGDEVGGLGVSGGPSGVCVQAGGTLGGRRHPLQKGHCAWAWGWGGHPGDPVPGVETAWLFMSQEGGTESGS